MLLLISVSPPIQQAQLMLALVSINFEVHSSLKTRIPLLRSKLKAIENGNIKKTIC